MKFEAIVAPTITELFEHQIQDMIFSGKLEIGEKLPTERELAESMNISKSAVHIGVKNLERLGFIRIVPRHGMYVANYQETGNIDTLIALLKYKGGNLDKHTIASFLQVREALEGMAMKMLSKNHSDGDILCLRRCVEDVEKACKMEPSPNIDKVVDLTMKYHKYIFMLSGNNMFLLITNAFKETSIIFWITWVRQVGINNVSKYLSKFTDCIESGDGDGAVTLFRQAADEYLMKI